MHAVMTWAISLVSIALVLIRPKKLAEAWWAAGGAVLLVASGLLSARAAAGAVANGLDVYLFLTGMMIMSELARREGVFDWVAAHAVLAAKGSRGRLFALIYGVGAAVRIFLSNDATAVVLTPAVLTAVRAAEVEPLPYLLACAWIANAASFVLPISNPANLVVYHGRMPSLGTWLATFGAPSIASVLVTFGAMRWLMRKRLKGQVKGEARVENLPRGGQWTLWGIGLLAVTLMAASALGWNLGAPACGVAVLIAAVVTLRDRDAPKAIVREVSWSVLVLVAGLFVIVEAMNRAGGLAAGVRALDAVRAWPAAEGALTTGFGIAVISNVMNNLPSGLLSGAAVTAAGIEGRLRGAVLIGVDLGPNLSVTGSLATILWLIALRREGEDVGFWKFLGYGALVMPPALALAILMIHQA